MILETNQGLQISNIPFLTIKDLDREDTFSKIHNLVLLLDEWQDYTTALKLRNKLKELIYTSADDKKLDSYNLVNYGKEISLLNFITLVNLTDREIEELFRTKAVEALKAGINILSKLELFILYFGDANMAANFANIVIRGLSYNEEVIGQNKIFLGSSDKPVDPQVKNWLRSYNQNFNANESRSTLQQGQYLSTNKDVLKLSPEDRNIIKEIVKIYDFLRFPDSEVASGVPVNLLPSEPIKPVTEGIGDYIEKGKSKLKQKQPSLGSVEAEIMSAYKGINSKQERLVAKQEAKLQKKFKGNVNKIRQEFFGIVQKKNTVAAIAILRLLAKDNDLERFLGEDEKLNKFLALTWEKQYGQQLAQEFKNNPAQVKFMRLFLQYILEQRLGMTVSDAARVGMQLGNILVSQGRKGYNKMAYFDLKSKSFNWFE